MFALTFDDKVLEGKFLKNSVGGKEEKYTKDRESEREREREREQKEKIEKNSKKLPFRFQLIEEIFKFIPISLNFLFVSFFLSACFGI